MEIAISYREYLLLHEGKYLIAWLVQAREYCKGHVGIYVSPFIFVYFHDYDKKKKKATYTYNFQLLSNVWRISELNKGFQGWTTNHQAGM